MNFCLCAKFVLICSKDCTLRFLDIRNGTAIFPILHMPSPVIQCVFVRWIRFFSNIFPLWIRLFNYCFLCIISEHKQWFGWCCHWMRTNSCMEFIRRINSHHSDMSWSVPEHIDHKANSFLLPRHWSWNSVYYVVKWMCLLLQQKPWVLVRDSFGFLMNRFDSIPLFFFQGSHWTAAIQ